jgi:magnesium chelatase family protein
MEAGEVTIARAALTLTYPARFMLAAAMNPCGCVAYLLPSQIQ